MYERFKDEERSEEIFQEVVFAYGEFAEVEMLLSSKEI